MTYSIVARDATTGALGVAVETAMFGAGSIVPWARAGVGAVATQAIAEVAYGPRCLDSIAAGATASAALAAAQAEDPLVALRQVGVVAADGSSAAATGDLCIDHAGQIVGDGFSVQGNMLASPDVWPAMAERFRSSTGPLAHRLLDALAAGEEAGGDARGRMSAAIVVVDGELPTTPDGGTLVDLRVDRSDDPLHDLRELLRARDAYADFERAVDQLFGGNPAGAIEAVGRGLALLPQEENLRFVRAGALMASGSTEAGLTELGSLVAGRSTWAIVIRSFAEHGLVAVPEGVDLDAITAPPPGA